MAGERAREPVDAALAADAADLDRLRDWSPSPVRLPSARRGPRRRRRGELRERLGLGRLAPSSSRASSRAETTPLAVGMDELRVEAARAPRPSGSGRSRRGRRPARGACSTRSAHDADEERGALERRRLVGDADLERAEARMRPHVPPDARVVRDHAELDEPLDPGLPRVVRAEDRRRARARQLARGCRHGSRACRSARRRRTASSPRARARRAARRAPPRAARSTAPRSRRRRARAGRSPPGAARRSRPARASARYRSSWTTGSASSRAVGCAPAAAITSPFARAIRSAARAQRRAAPRPPRRRRRRLRVELDDRGVQLGLQRPGQLELRGLAHEHVDARRRLERLRVEDHHLLLDAERVRRAIRRSARSITLAADAVHRPACGLPRVVRRARAVSGSYVTTRGLRPTSFARCAWRRRFGSSRSCQTSTRCAAVMNSATKTQPGAGHGNGSVETQNQPAWSSASSPIQISSSTPASCTAPARPSWKSSPSIGRKVAPARAVRRAAPRGCLPRRRFAALCWAACTRNRAAPSSSEPEAVVPESTSPSRW